MRAFNWESLLLHWAYQCTDNCAGEVEPESPALAEAYQACAELTAAHSRTFYMASGLLPAGKRRAVRALYAFCRRTDDLIDEAGTDGAARLVQWRSIATQHHPPHDDLLALAWADTRRRYKIPACYVEQFFAGVERDLKQTRYATFAELAQYAYGVASTVGLMSAHIVGFQGPQAIPYAVKLGVALQMTNILRDIKEDWDAGRLYLPQDELASFGLSEADVAAGTINDRWRDFMAYQIARNRELYGSSRPGIAMLNGDGRLAIAAAAVLYEGILDDIVAHDYDVFSRRASIGLAGKLLRLPTAWRLSHDMPRLHNMASRGG